MSDIKTGAPCPICLQDGRYCPHATPSPKGKVVDWIGGFPIIELKTSDEVEKIIEMFDARFAVGGLVETNTVFIADFLRSTLTALVARVRGESSARILESQMRAWKKEGALAVLADLEEMIPPLRNLGPHTSRKRGIVTATYKRNQDVNTFRSRILDSIASLRASIEEKV